MYTTKPLSEFWANREATTQLPPEGLNSGYLVIQTRDSELDVEVSCLGGKESRVLDLPFPQNNILTIQYTTGRGKNRATSKEIVMFVPVMNQPLSANRYYAVVASRGQHKGKIFTCSKEDKRRLSNTSSSNIKRVFDHRDIYQQLEIIAREGGFTAKSVARDGVPPWIFRQKYWKLYGQKPGISYPSSGNPFRNFNLINNQDVGIVNTQRSKLPVLDMGTTRTKGKWYIPFFFVKEEMTLEEQMNRAVFYKVQLEQFYEEANDRVERTRILFEGRDPMQQMEDMDDGFVWFMKRDDLNNRRIALSLPLWEWIKLEEKSQGWVEGDEVMDLDTKFESFVLVDRFWFQRMDGTHALALDFIHANKYIAN